jgi:hypothetical protein
MWQNQSAVISSLQNNHSVTFNTICFHVCPAYHIHLGLHAVLFLLMHTWLLTHYVNKQELN